MGSCSAPISSLQHIWKVCIISLFLLLFELASSIYLCFNLKSDAYTSIVFLLEILSMQFIKYSLCSLEFINTKTHRKSNERERDGSKAQREWHRYKSQTTTTVGLQPLKLSIKYDLCLGIWLDQAFGLDLVLIQVFGFSMLGIDFIRSLNLSLLTELLCSLFLFLILL